SCSHFFWVTAHWWTSPTWRCSASTFRLASPWSRCATAGRRRTDVPASRRPDHSPDRRRNLHPPFGGGAAQVKGVVVRRRGARAGDPHLGFHGVAPSAARPKRRRRRGEGLLAMPRKAIPWPELFAAAAGARANAYAPYSKFEVGAAVYLQGG